MQNARWKLSKIIIGICSSTHDTKQVKVEVIIAVDGTVLLLMLVFRGQPSGRIPRTGFATYLTTHHYRCQVNAWMDKDVMIVWVEEVLAPYIAMALEYIVPLLVLDSYQCHMMALVVLHL
jgi:hypothetical protein